MNWHLLLGFATALIASLTGCDDEAPAGNGDSDVAQDGSDDGVTEAGDTPADQNVTPPACYSAREGSPMAAEALGEGEHSDCISGCAHALNFFLVDLDLNDGGWLRARIDDAAHEYSSLGIAEGPDVDIIGIVAQPRTMVEIIVEPLDDASLMDPVVRGHDGSFEVLYNSDMVEGFRPARIVFATPYVHGLPFNVIVEHAANYDPFREGRSGADEYEGGDDYMYALRIREFDFAPQELGNMGPERSTVTVDSARFECAGDTHYYRFYAPAGSQATVNFQRTGSDQLLGVLSGYETSGGVLEYNGIFADPNPDAGTPNDGQVTLPPTAFAPCAGCGPEGLSEYIFSVAEWNGGAGEDFTYSLTVTVAQ